MAFNNVAAATHGVPLNTDFGQAPVGELNGRRIEAAEPQAPRAGSSFLSRIGDGIKSLASRVVSALTPESVRARQDFRQGLEATGQHVAQVLGSLSAPGNQPLEPQRTLALLDDLPDVAAPVTGQGHALGDVVDQRLAVHIGNMTGEQRTALFQGLEQARDIPELANNTTVASVRSALMRPLIDRAAPQIQAAVAHATGQAQQIAQIENAMADKLAAAKDRMSSEQYDALQDQYQAQMSKTYDLLAGVKTVAARELQTFGLDGLDAAAQDRIVAAMIKQELNDAIENGDTNQFAAAQILVRLPVSQLTLLRNAPLDLVDQDDLFAADNAINGAVGIRAERLENTLRHQTDRLNQNAPDNARVDGRQLMQAQQTLTALHDLNQNFGLHESEFVAPAAAQLQDQMAAARNARMQDAQTSVATTFDAILSGNVAGQMQGLAHAMTFADTAIQEFNIMGARIKDADGVMEFRERIATGAMGELDDARLTALYSALHSQESHTLAATLDEGGNAVLMTGPPSGSVADTAGRAMLNRNLDLGMLRGCAKQLMQDRGLVLPDSPPVGAPAPDAAMLQAIRQQTGVQLGIIDGAIDVQALPVSDELQSAVTEALNQAIAQAQQKFESDKDLDTFTVNGKEPGSTASIQLDDQLKPDANRSFFQIQKSDSSPVVQVSRPGDDLAVGGQNVAQHLYELTGQNAEQARMVSHFAHQGLSAVFMKVVAADAELNPVQFPPGTNIDASYPAEGMDPFSPIMLGETTSTYTLIGDDEGGVTIELSTVRQGGTLMSNGLQYPVMLNEDESYEAVTYSIRVGPDLQVTPVGNVLHGSRVVPR